MRGAHFDCEHQHASALARTQKSDFVAHNRRIGADSAARQRVMLRATKGSALLLASDVHQVSLSDIRGSLGVPLSEEQQRIILASYIWSYVYEGLVGIAPAKPSTEEVFFDLVAEARSYVSQGLLLPDPLLVIYVAPSDFDRSQGPPLPYDRRKKRFRTALYAARRHAERLQAMKSGSLCIQGSGGNLLFLQNPHTLKPRRPMGSRFFP
jgi:hypothetical protein